MKSHFTNYEQEFEEAREMRTMQTRELVAYWNILQFSGRCINIGNQAARHLPMVKDELRRRGIYAVPGRRIIRLRKEGRG